MLGLKLNHVSKRGYWCLSHLWHGDTKDLMVAGGGSVAAGDLVPIDAPYMEVRTRTCGDITLKVEMNKFKT